MSLLYPDSVDRLLEVTGPPTDDLLATLEGQPAPTDRARYTAAYYRHVLDQPAFETTVLPVGEGVAISCRTDQYEADNTGRIPAFE